MVDQNLTKFLNIQIICIILTIPLCLQIILKMFFNSSYPDHKIKVLDWWSIIDLGCTIINVAAYLIVKYLSQSYSIIISGKINVLDMLSYGMILVLIAGYIKLLFYILLLESVASFLYTIYKVRWQILYMILIFLIICFIFAGTFLTLF